MLTPDPPTDAPGEAPRVGVVVLNWNSAWFTRRCLRALARTDYPADRVEVVLADNGSVDGSLEQLRASFAGLRIVANGANLGFAEGCNRAIRELLAGEPRVRYVALVNNDAWPEPGWLAAMVEQMEAHPRAGAASARLVLEPGFVALDVEAVPTAGKLARGAAPVMIEQVRLDGTDVTASVRTAGFYDDGALDWPAQRRWRLEGDRGRIWVPAGAPAHAVEVRLSGAAGRVTVSTDGPGGPVAVAVTAAAPVAHLAVGAERTVLLNGLGTGLNVVGEGYDIGYGEPDAGVGPGSGPDAEMREAGPVDGFCGGGAILRTDALAEVGLLDPAFFAYYEDTDLSWRLRNAGWEVRTAPDAVIHHAFGGSGGGGSRLHVFLDRRNWLLTNLRNGTATDRRRAWGAYWRAVWRLFRTNYFGKVRRGHAPQWEPLLTWKLAFLSVLAHRPGLRAGTPAGLEPVGLAPSDRVRSLLQPGGGPGAPRPRPGGPLVVYVDVGETLKAHYRAGIQRVVCALVAAMPDADDRVEVVPIRHEPRHGRFRRITAAEYDSLLRAGLAPDRPDDSPATATAKHALRSGLGRLGVLSAVRTGREKVFGRRRRALEDSLLLDHLAPGAVLFEVDAVWNDLDVDRADMLERLRADGVHVATFVHDLLPIESPDWFAPRLLGIFVPAVAAQLECSELLVCASEATRRSIAAVCAARGIDEPPVAVVPLGAEDPGDGQRQAALPSGLEGARYLLVVGTLETRKNHALALDVFDRLSAGHDDLHLVLAGRFGWGVDEVLGRIEGHPLRGTRLHWLDDVHDDELDALYRHAFLVLVPSRSEGFGLPVVEALVRGVPVLASSGGALPEAGGAAADYADAAAVDEWVAAVDRQLTDPEARDEAMARVRAFAVRPWPESAAGVAAALVAAFGTP